MPDAILLTMLLAIGLLGSKMQVLPLPKQEMARLSPVARQQLSSKR